MSFMEKVGETLKPWQILISVIFTGGSIAWVFISALVHFNNLETRVVALEHFKTPDYSKQITDLQARIQKLEDQVQALNIPETSKRLEQMSYQLSHSLDPATTGNQIKNLENQLHTLANNLVTTYNLAVELQKKSLYTLHDQNCDRLSHQATSGMSETGSFGPDVTKLAEELMGREGCNK